MGNSTYLRKRRKRLWEKDPHCHWCRRDLKWYDLAKGRMPEDYPTIDHLTSRFFGKRTDPGFKERTLVLACPKCNCKRQQEEHAKHIWRTRWKSGSFPHPFKWLGKLLKIIRGQAQIT